jgi:hypothetical protein
MAAFFIQGSSVEDSKFVTAQAIQRCMMMVCVWSLPGNRSCQGFSRGHSDFQMSRVKGEDHFQAVAPEL